MDRTSVTALQVFWGLSALIGLVVVGWPMSHAPSFGVFMTELNQTWSSLLVSLDLLFVGVAAVVFAVIEARRLGMRFPWIWVPLAVVLPGAFVVPFFFLMRERAVIRSKASA